MIEQIKLVGFEQIGESYTIRLPTSCHVSKKVRKALNLNVYRNLHFQSLNKQKSNFESEVFPLLKNIPRMETIWLHYTIYASNSGRLDTMNIGSIVDKYFSDTLVAAGKIRDDDYKHIVLNTFSFGGVCPMDGHVTVTINKLEKHNMRVLLDQEDIQKALDAYLTTLGIQGATGVELGFEHGEVIAEVMMGDAKPKNKGGRPRGSKNKPKLKEDEDAIPDTDTDSTGADSSSGIDSGSGDEETKSDSARETESADETSTKESKGGGKGNLFDDEPESQSSSNNEAENSSSNEEVATVKTRGKKPSIFDAD